MTDPAPSYALLATALGVCVVALCGCEKQAPHGKSPTGISSAGRGDRGVASVRAVPEEGQGFTIDLGSSVTLETVWIPGGTFMMGSRLTPAEIVSKYGGKEEHYTDERPVHTVEVDGFWMGKYEVTNAQYRRFRPGHSSRDHKGRSLNDDDQPVLYVSWDDSKAFCDWLSRKTGEAVRLPTEAEWEYACRAGTDSVRYWGGDDESMGQYANGYDRSGKDAFGLSWAHAETTDGHKVSAPVGCFKPNAFGLYDMIGNAYEWCGDWYDEDYYAGSPGKNPRGPSSGESPVLRGGGWYSGPGSCRSALRVTLARSSAGNSIGFRVVVGSSSP